jgi:teichuronic acid biosynthesis glycosyltransferase TuaC
VLTFTTIFPNSQLPLHGLFVRERVRALARLCDLRVMAPVPWVPRARWLPERYYRHSLVVREELQGSPPVTHPRFVVFPKVLKSSDGWLLAASCLLPMVALRRRFSFDVIDAHWACPDGVAAVLLARHFGIPVSVTVRGDDINVFARQSGRRQAIRWALRQADLVITLSQDLKAGVQELGVPSSRIVVIPNGIDTTRFRRVSRAGARQRLGLEEDGRVLLSVGRLHTSKSYPVLVEALRLLAEEFPDLSLIIVGGPDSESDATPAISAAARGLSIADRVRLVGTQTPDQLVDWYNAADLFCLSTSREGSANVLLEAVACGLPCVTTPVGGNAEAISGPDVGFLVPPEPPRFAAAIRAALTRAWDREAIAERARQRTWHVVADECCVQLARIAGSESTQSA